MGNKQVLLIQKDFRKFQKAIIFMRFQVILLANGLCRKRKDIENRMFVLSYSTFSKVIYESVRRYIEMNFGSLNISNLPRSKEKALSFID